MRSPRSNIALTLLAAVATATGCTDGDTAPTDDAPSTASAGRLDILPAPKEFHALLPTFDRDATADGEVLILRDEFVLGLGTGYAENLELRFQPYVMSEECDYILGELEVSDAWVNGKLVATSFGPEGKLWISPQNVGDEELHIRGTLHASDVGSCGIVAPGSDRPFEVRINVRVLDRAPSVAVELGGPCADTATKLAQSGAPLRNTQATALDANGEPFVFANASPDAQVPLTVLADPETLLESGAPSAGIGWLTVEGDPGDVTVEFAEQEVAAFELVDASAITSARVAFGLGGGAPFELENGGEYTPSESNAGFIFALLSETFVGATPTCTQGRAEDFEMSAPPASACRVPNDGEQHLQKFYPEGMGGARIGTDPQVERSGTCRFDVRAPNFAAGEGWQTSMSVTLMEADELWQGGRE